MCVCVCVCVNIYIYIYIYGCARRMMINLLDSPVTLPLEILIVHSFFFLFYILLFHYIFLPNFNDSLFLSIKTFFFLSFNELLVSPFKKYFLFYSFFLSSVVTYNVLLLTINYFCFLIMRLRAFRFVHSFIWYFLFFFLSFFLWRIPFFFFLSLVNCFLSFFLSFFWRIASFFYLLSFFLSLMNSFLLSFILSIFLSFLLYFFLSIN